MPRYILIDLTELVFRQYAGMYVPDAYAYHSHEGWACIKSIHA